MTDSSRMSRNHFVHLGESTMNILAHIMNHSCGPFEWQLQDYAKYGTAYEFDVVELGWYSRLNINMIVEWQWVVFTWISFQGRTGKLNSLCSQCLHIKQDFRWLHWVCACILPEVPGVAHVCELMSDMKNYMNCWLTVVMCFYFSQNLTLGRFRWHWKAHTGYPTG